ncbi:hypothetical protein D6827_02150, partial [Candidatus Parcubacteria bacterium]
KKKAAKKPDDKFWLKAAREAFLAVVDESERTPLVAALYHLLVSGMTNAAVVYPQKRDDNGEHLFGCSAGALMVGCCDGTPSKSVKEAIISFNAGGEPVRAIPLCGKAAEAARKEGIKTFPLEEARFAVFAGNAIYRRR